MNAATGTPLTWPDQTHKMVTHGKAKRGLETIISPEDAHKTGNRNVRKNSKSVIYGENATTDQPNSLDSPQLMTL
jgi:hypothetical protein